MAVSPARPVALFHERWTFRPGPAAARVARQAVERHLRAHTTPGELRVLRMLVSELVTNAVEHGPRAGVIDVEVALAGDLVRVEVRDDGPAFRPPWPPAVRPDGSTGYGLVLVHHAAAAWGLGEDGSARVWFELERR